MELLRDDQYLEIRNVTEHDEGIYTCLAQNLAGKAKQNLVLQVLGRLKLDFETMASEFVLKKNVYLVPPRIEQEPTMIEAIVNSSVNLACLASGNPKPTVRARSLFEHRRVQSSICD